MSKKKITILSDNRKGFLKQLIALCKILSLDYDIILLPNHKISILPLWAISFIHRRFLQFLSKETSDVIFVSGNRFAKIALWLKKEANKCVVCIQHPSTLGVSSFNCIITPQHDDFNSTNIINTDGSLFHFDNIPTDSKKINNYTQNKKNLTLIIGGPNKYFSFDSSLLEAISNIIKKYTPTHNLLCVFSRRTPIHFIQKIKKHSLAKYIIFENDIHQGVEAYHHALSIADHIIVTGDSINMISEALYFKKPVYFIRLSGRSKKFNCFYKLMIEKYGLKIWDGALDLSLMSDNTPCIYQDTKEKITKNPLIQKLLEIE